MFRLRLLWLCAFFSLPASATDFGEVQEMLDAAVEEGTVAGGTLMIIEEGEVTFNVGFGYADVDSKTSFKTETPVIIASISKPMLGTVAFRLAQQGEVDLNAPITQYLPEFAGLKLESGKPQSRPPTTIELFTHTSGLRHSEAKGGRPWFASWTAGKPLGDVVARYATDIPAESQPRSRYAYSGIGTDVAARVLEVATDTPRNEMLVEVLTDQLGMTSTFYRDAESLQRVAEMPTRYRYGKQGQLVADRKRFVPPKNMYSSSGGAIISTSSDLAKWLMMFRNGGKHRGKVFLNEQVLGKMLAPYPPSLKTRGGFSLHKRARGKTLGIGHTGSSGTSCWIDFENDVIYILLTQTKGTDIKPWRLRLEKRIRELVAE